MIAGMLGEDSIGKWQAAAIQRRREADLLLSEAQFTGAVYLLGYVAECYVKAAFFRTARYRTADAIARDERMLFEKEAKDLGLMPPREPHHIPGWARLLIHYRDTQNRPLRHGLAVELHEVVDHAYEVWRPTIRYRQLALRWQDIKPAIDAAEWLKRSYNLLY